MIPRRHFHRVVFGVAGIYNILWGLYSAIDPQWLFRFARMPHENHPQVFACVGMLVGLYGALYLEVARVPERGWVIAAVSRVKSSVPSASRTSFGAGSGRSGLRFSA